MNFVGKSFLLLRELGLKQLIPYAGYQLKLKTGILQQMTPAGGWKSRLATFDIDPIQIPFPTLEKDALADQDSSTILAEADEIVQGIFHPFGGPSSPLTFTLAEPKLKHWTHYGAQFSGGDIKFTWEPARFSWAFPLVEAANLTGENRYAACFWSYFEDFTHNHPVNLGPNWASAQEAAVRLVPLVFAWQNLKEFQSSTNERREEMVGLVEQSAFRISSTLDYARSQNNNHLLSEALGLILAGTFLSGQHPLAAKWENQGFHEFEEALLAQIEPDGTYSQHSTNYHRLMLQLSLLYYVYAQFRARQIEITILERLADSTRWLAGLIDPVSGKAPNLGHNDGTLLLPFGAVDYADYRPTLQAASLAFLKQNALPPGPWDALANFVGIPTPDQSAPVPETPAHLRAIHRVGDAATWGTLRAVEFHQRPAHADQLNADLWWDGFNIALDAGSYLYNAPPPWNNSLAKTCVHNTITLDDQDQMLRAGRFLWLKRVNAVPVLQKDTNSISASMGWRSDPPFRQIRTLTFNPGSGFTVLDKLTPLQPLKDPLEIQLQWLLPDWKYTLLPNGIVLNRDDHQIELDLSAPSEGEASRLMFSLIRAGEALAGSLVEPIRGWVSPTYGMKRPALSLVLQVAFKKEIELVSNWKLVRSPAKTG